MVISGMGEGGGVERMTKVNGLVFFDLIGACRFFQCHTVMDLE